MMRVDEAVCHAGIVLSFWCCGLGSVVLCCVVYCDAELTKWSTYLVYISVSSSSNRSQTA